MPAKLAELKKDLRALGTPEKAKGSAWFFKTGPGQYGEGDVFIGVTVPEARKIAKRHAALSLADAESLLRSREHEFRLVALLILVSQFEKGDAAAKAKIHKLYLANTAWINNWDLVDTSASCVVGGYLGEKRQLLAKLAKSKSLWERRIAIVATFAYIKKGDPETTFEIAELLMKDKEDLIQKATGWMLRETGKRCSVKEEKEFLAKHYKQMPRTMLRYAIEHFPPEIRQNYLKGLV